MHAYTGSKGLYRLTDITCSRFRVRVSHPKYGDQNWDLGRIQGKPEYQFNVLFHPIIGVP
jgi:hypothetical protein